MSVINEYQRHKMSKNASRNIVLSRLDYTCPVFSWFQITITYILVFNLKEKLNFEIF
jgi:hypothetical protein